jgi:hypothetical protein
MNRAGRRTGRTLSETLDRVIERATNDEPASFADLAIAAGLDPARDFIGASLRGIDLRGENLCGFNFSRADLVGADLRGAYLEGVSFSGADTTGCLGLPHELLTLSGTGHKSSTTPKRFQAFFSFAHYDAETDSNLIEALTVELERRVTARLRNDGFAIWRDVSKLRTGDQWNSAIEGALLATLDHIGLLSQGIRVL